MPERSTYLAYVQDDGHMAQFQKRESRYLQKMRESDRILLDLVADRLGSGNGEGKTLLDVGCSYGIFLRHLRDAFPKLALHGADLAATVINENQKNPELAGIDFFVADLLSFPDDRKFDVIVANATFLFLNHTEFPVGIAKIAQALAPGGTLLAFDYFHPFDQELAIEERSPAVPHGLWMYSRSYRAGGAALAAAGLGDVEFRPFEMPFDLPRPQDPGSNDTYTISAGNRRLAFRGAFCQPWCHLVATKKGRTTV